MRLALATFTLVAAASGSAAANPTVSADACTVVIVRAPAEVRAAVDRWVDGEHHCVTTLELRAIPVEDGYYLFARDSFGREHERVVPDAQTAGVLVASWIADDSPMVVLPPRAAMVATPPPLREVAVERVVTVARPRESTRHDHELVFGGLGNAGVWGFRADVDAVMLTSVWSIAFGLGMVNSRQLDGTPDGLSDIVMMGTLARRWHAGSFEFRLSGGTGIAYTFGSNPAYKTHGPTPVLEVGALLGYGIDRWAIVAGPTLSAYMRSDVVYDEPLDPMVYDGRSATLVLFGGLRRRL
ncbi:MAG: hypothetical protein ABI867_27400 [Kofleriaceae bacterium]